MLSNENGEVEFNVSTRSKKWDEVPENIKELLVNNVYCRNCGVTTIVDYEPSLSDGLVVLEVKCKTCGAPVARVID